MKTSHSFRGQAIILEPVTNEDNVIQPLLDSVSGLIIRQHSPTQSAPLLVFEDYIGNILSTVSASGDFAGSVAGAPALAPATAGRNLLQATADVSDLILRPFSDAQTSPVFLVQNAAGTTDEVSILANGSLTCNQAIVTLGTPASDLAVFSDDWGFAFDSVIMIHALGCNIDSVGVQPDGATASTHFIQTFSENTAAPVGSRVGFAAAISSGCLVDDAGVTTGEHMEFHCGLSLPMAMETNKIAFFTGTSPVAQQVGASATGIAAVVDANAKDALSAIQSALAAYGLVTAPA